MAMSTTETRTMSPRPAIKQNREVRLGSVSLLMKISFNRPRYPIDSTMSYGWRKTRISKSSTYLSGIEWLSFRHLFNRFISFMRRIGQMGIPTRIIAIDEHVLFRESLVHLLQCEPDFQIIAQCNSVIEARLVLICNPVDVVLWDYERQHGTGADQLRNLMDWGHGVKVLVVTGGISDTVT